MNPIGSQTYNITANGTTVIPGRFIIHALVVNTKGGTGHTAVIYDSNETYGANAARKKGTLDTVNIFGRVEYGFPVFDGIYIVTGGGTTPDITLIYSEF